MAGRKIDDHKFWAGGPGKHSVLPDGPHKVMAEKSTDGAGHLMHEYPDTTETIARDQKHGEGKIKGHHIKPGFRY